MNPFLCVGYIWWFSTCQLNCRSLHATDEVESDWRVSGGLNIHKKRWVHVDRAKQVAKTWSLALFIVPSFSLLQP